jgi:RNA 3'-terminal phosphate cyclase (ATP)
VAALGTPILVDGTYGEGGGALLRAALAMSALTQQPLRVNGVRGSTNHPGLDVEDLILVRALAVSCAAESVGAELGSTTLSFLPTRRAHGLKMSLDLPEMPVGGRNPNANVVLNALLPVLGRTGTYSEVRVQGETYGPNVLSYDYFANVTLMALRRMGLYAVADQDRASFGRLHFGRLHAGEVSMDVEPSALQGLQWPDRGKLIECRAIVTTGELSHAVSQRAVSHLTNLASGAKIALEIESGGVDSVNTGAFVTAWATYERGMGGSTSIGAKSVRVETVAQAAFEGMIQWMQTEATVDAFLADQVLMTAVLAEDGSTFKVSKLTPRFLTTVWVVKQFLPIHITVKGAEGEAGTVTIRR